MAEVSFALMVRWIASARPRPMRCGKQRHPAVDERWVAGQDHWSPRYG